MKTKLLAALFGLLVPALGFSAEGKTTCREQTTQGHTAKLCVLDPGMFKHYQYTLTVDGEHIFTLVDDYVETISLTHKILEGPSLELPLSKQGLNPITLSGGCQPILNTAGNAEIGRLCNIKWGKIDIVKDARFDFE